MRCLTKALVAFAIAVTTVGTFGVSAGATTIDCLFDRTGPVGPGATFNVTIAGRGGVPATGVGSVALNVTATNPTSNGYLTVWPTGNPNPTPPTSTSSPDKPSPTWSSSRSVPEDKSPSSTRPAAPTSSSTSRMVPHRTIIHRPHTSPTPRLTTRHGHHRWHFPSTGPIRGRLHRPAHRWSGWRPSFGRRIGRTQRHRNQPDLQRLPHRLADRATPTQRLQPQLRRRTNHPQHGHRPRSAPEDKSPSSTRPAAPTSSSTYSGGSPPDHHSPASHQPDSSTHDQARPPSMATSDQPAQYREPGSTNLLIAGRGGVPASGVGSVALNVTATNPTSNGYLTVWPTGQPQPNASNLNFVAGQTIPNMVIVPLGAGGQISIFNETGSTDVIVDVLGWFPTGPSFTGLTPARLLDSRIPPAPPPPAELTFSAGTHLVNASIPPGRYFAVGATSGCYWERLSGLGGTLGEIIANDFRGYTGRVIVDIRATDVAFSFDAGCGQFEINATGRDPRVSDRSWHTRRRCEHRERYLHNGRAQWVLLGAPDELRRRVARRSLQTTSSAPPDLSP